MPENIHALTNLSSGHSYQLDVPVGSDVAGTAKAFLAAENLPFDVQGGFYVSVFPTGFDAAGDMGGSDSDTDADTDTTQLTANPPSNLDSSPNDTPYDN